jgi:hypothetical protein
MHVDKTTLRDDYKAAFGKSLEANGGTQQTLDKFGIAEFKGDKAPTKEELNEQLGIVFMRNSLPFSLIDEPEFRRLLEMTSLYGHASHTGNLNLVARTTLSTKVIPDASRKFALSALSRHKNSSIYGSSLVFDGVTTVNKDQVINFMLETAEVKSLYTSHVMTGGRATGEYLNGLCEELLDGEYNLGEGKALEEMRSYVWAFGSDNAANVQNCLSRLNVSRGIVIFGCQVHAMNNVIEGVVDCLESTCIADMHLVIRIFRNYRQPKSILKAAGGKILIRVAGTRFASNFLAISRLLSMRKCIKDSVNSEDYKEFYKGTPDVKDDAMRAKNILNDDAFWV